MVGLIYGGVDESSEGSRWESQQFKEILQFLEE